MTTLIGTNPDQVPVNSMLGGMAYQDPESINVKDFNSSGTANINSLVSPTASVTNLSYSGTLTGGTGIINIGSSQIYKDATGNVGIGNSPVSNGKTLTLVNASTGNSSFYLQNSTTGFTATDGTLLQLDGSAAYLWNFENSTLSLGTNNTEYVRLTGAGDVVNLGTGATKLQEGTTAQRPASPQEGMIRKNSTLGVIEGYSGGWNYFVQSNSNSLENRNLIINGDFNINSYGTERHVFGGAGGGFVDNTSVRIQMSDRWLFQASVANALSYVTDGTLLSQGIPQEKITRSLTISNVTSGVTSSDWTLGQRFENGFIDRLFGDEVITLSFWVKNTSGAPTSLNYDIRSPGTTNVWSSSSFTASSTSITSGSLSIDSNWTKKQVTFTNASGNNRGLQLTISASGHLNGVVYIAGVQLERGSFATAFEVLPENVQLERCRRYRQYFPFISGMATGGGVTVPITLPVPMRNTPTVTCPSYTYTDGSSSSTITPATVTIPQGGSSALMVSLSGGGMTSTAGKYITLYSSGPGVGIVLSSEL